MIFKTRKAFQEAVERETSERMERIRTDQRLFELEEDIRKLRYRIERLEPVTDIPTTTCCKEATIV